MLVPPILPIAERLSAIVVSREETNRTELLTLLNEHFPRIDVVARTESIESARDLLPAVHPDVFFVDSRMPEAKRPELLDFVSEENVPIVVVRSRDRYDVRTEGGESMFRVTGISKLRELLDHLTSLQNRERFLFPFLTAFQDALVEQTCYLQNSKPTQRIVLSTEKGFVIEETGNIVRVQSENNYVTIFRNGLKNIVLSKSLKDFEAVLDREQFVRIHNSHIINIDYLSEFEVRQGGYAVLRDGSRIPVSRRRQGLLVEKIKRFACV